MAFTTSSNKRKSPNIPKYFQMQNQSFGELVAHPPVPALLQQWVNSLPESDIAFCRKHYGNIISLTKIQIHYPLIEALIHYWDPETICFRFANFELTPTLEEYSQLLNLPYDQNNVILPFESGGKGTMNKLFGIPCQKIDLQTIPEGTHSFCSINLIYEYFQSNECFFKYSNLFKGDQVIWSLHRIRALIFVILGTLIFPEKEGFINSRMGPIVYQMGNRDAIVPMILGETIRSLTFSSIKKKISFLGCAPLLQVWFLEHLSQFRSIQVNKYFDVDFIDHFSRSYKKPNHFSTVEKWAKYLKDLSYREIIWKARWLPTGAIIMQCDGHHFVPLFGFNGMAAYYPNRVVRQYGLIQRIPKCDDISEWLFDYKAQHSKEQVDKAKHLWRSRKCDRIPVGEGDDTAHLHKADRDYHLWIEAGFGKVAPLVEAEKSPPPPNPGYWDHLRESELRHAKNRKLWIEERNSLLAKQHQLEMLNHKLEEQRQRVEIQNQILIRQNQVEDERNQKLIENYRSLLENNQSLSKENQDLVEENQSLEETNQYFAEKNLNLMEKRDMLEEQVRRLTNRCNESNDLMFKAVQEFKDVVLDATSLVHKRLPFPPNRKDLEEEQDFVSKISSYYRTY